MSYEFLKTSVEERVNCDVRFAAAGARLGQPEINIGFIPPVGTTQSLARLLGRPRAFSATPDFAEGLRAFLEKRSPNWE